MRNYRMTLIVAASIASGASAAELPAVVHKPAVDVRAQPAFDAPKIATLQRDTAVTVSAQQGLWYALRMPADATGYVRVNDVRLAYAGVEDGAANVRVLMGGKAGQGRVTETAGVRGIEESDLKSAAFDRTQLDGMVAQRVDGPAAAAYAGERGWQATSVAYAGEAKRGKSGGKATAESTSSMAASAKAVGGLFGSLGGEVGSMLGGASKAMPKVRGRAGRRGTRARPGNHRSHSWRASVVGRCRCSTARQRGRTLGRRTDQSPGAAVDLRRDRYARGQRVRRAGRLHPDHARPVRAAVFGQRTRRSARSRDHPLRAARPLQGDPQAGDGGGGQGARLARRQDRHGQPSPAATPGATPRNTARPS